MPAHSLVMIDLSGQQLTSDEKALFAYHQVGGICLFRRNIKDRFQIAEFTQELRELCGEQLIIGIDQEGGTVVRATDIPYSIGNMALGSANDLELTEQIAFMSSRALKSVGINVNFAPVADTNNNPNNPVIGDRSFSSDAKKVAQHVAAFVKGSQAAGLAATLKHFPGHGDTSIDSHHDLPVLNATLERLEELELLPFKAGIAAGAACMMSYHGVISALDPSLPATLSKKVMIDFLRTDLGFQGVSFSDALEMQAVGKTYGTTESVIRALEAGIDMPLYNVHTQPVSIHEAIFNAVDKAADNGILDKAMLDASHKRLKTLSQSYPATYNPNEAWQKEDEALIKKAIHKTVCKIGGDIALNANETITLIASEKDVGGSASDMVGNPAFTLATKLESRGFSVNRIFYHPDSFSVENILEPLGAINLFVSSSRQRISEKEVVLANNIANRSERFTHIALWNPYSCFEIAKPAILSFGFQDASLERTIDVLLGSKAEGTAAFEFTP